MRSVSIALLALVSICGDCFAQIEISYTTAKVLTGVVAPRIVGDRVIVADDSKPQVTSVAIVKVVSSEKVRVKARKSLFETTEMVPISDTEYLLVGQGKFLVEAVSASWDRSFVILVGNEVNPNPPDVDNDDPKPTDPTLIDVVQKVLPAQAKGFEEAFNEAATKVESKQIKTDRELLEFVKPLTTKARLEANKPFDVLLETQIPESFSGKEVEIATLLRRIAKSWK